MSVLCLFSCLFVGYSSCIRVLMTKFLTCLCGSKLSLFDFFFSDDFRGLGTIGVVVCSTVEHANDLDIFGYVFKCSLLN